MSERTNKWIGQRTIRPDGADKVTGRAAFAADTQMAGMIWGKVLRSPHPHANIRGIDTSKAAALPGVKAALTGADLPEAGDQIVDLGEAPPRVLEAQHAGGPVDVHLDDPEVRHQLNRASAPPRYIAEGAIAEYR